MTYPLSKGARAWQEKARKFVDEEPIPWEVEAEMNGGLLPEKVRARHHRLARELGLGAISMPRELDSPPTDPDPPFRREHIVLDGVGLGKGSMTIAHPCWTVETNRAILSPAKGDGAHHPRP